MTEHLQARRPAIVPVGGPWCCRAGAGSRRAGPVPDVHRVLTCGNASCSGSTSTIGVPDGETPCSGEIQALPGRAPAEAAHPADPVGHQVTDLQEQWPEAPERCRISVPPVASPDRFRLPDAEALRQP